ncbi:MAG: SDR family oxidoreductase [Promethearchaeota archaeon]
MDLGLKDKVALVLAASKGLGLACAKGLYKEGAHVVICSRFRENLDKAVADIRGAISINAESKIISIVADLMLEADIDKLVQQTIEEFGRIDILVHNAGGPVSAPIEKLTEKDWANALQLNLKSFIYIVYKVLPIMQKQKFGRILPIASVSVKQPIPNLALSNTTRMGILGFAKTLANEYGKDNILVNVIAPGPTLTDRMKQLIEKMALDMGKSEEEVSKAWTDQISLGRLGTPEEFANMVVFLASERASFITGTSIQIDGGFVKGAF